MGVVRDDSDATTQASIEGDRDHEFRCRHRQRVAKQLKAGARG
jgi:hypothetical protein